jgi:hypothetical protein
MKTKYYRRGQAGGTGDGNYMCYDERKRRHRTQGNMVEVHIGKEQTEERERSGGGHEQQ